MTKLQSRYPKTLEEITVDLLNAPSKWPMVTHLCVKKLSERPDGMFPKCGIIVRQGFHTGKIEIENHPDKLTGGFIERFGSVDDLIAAGWVVD